MPCHLSSLAFISVLRKTFTATLLSWCTAPLCASQGIFLILFFLLVPPCMQQLCPIPASHHTSRTPYISKNLTTSMHVYVRHEAVRKALQPPYDGPFEVIVSTDKFYTVLVNGQGQTISLDWLKTAHLDSPSSTATPMSSTATPASSTAPPASKSTVSQEPVRTTRSGRSIHFPEGFTF